ncbi:MAG: LacI family DNA-binding transcriptional regulator [Planctomycetota bacterium]
MPATLQQIADKAGVTRSQVSRVLNGRYKENRPAIAQRAANIRQIAEELGYRPNAAARSTSNGRFGQAAFITCGDLGFDWFAPELLHGIHQGLDRTGDRLMVNELSGEELADENKVPRLFRESAVDGMLVNIDAKLPRRIVDMFDVQPVPTVLLNQKRETRAVYPDEYAGGRSAAEYLLADGRRDIAFLYLQPAERSPHFSRMDRLRGFQDAMHDAGLPGDRVLAGDPGYHGSLGNGEKIVDAFLASHPKLDAVVCYSLPEAGSVYLAAAKRGLSVPDDLRVLVFNHQLAHAQTGIPADTMLVPFEQVGRQAVDMLSAMGRGESTRRPPAVRVPYQHIYRADLRETLTIGHTGGSGVGA